MYHATVPAEFDRQMGCTPDELVGWLPRALPDAHLDFSEPRTCCVARYADGTLLLTWERRPDRKIGLLEIPQTHVTFAYESLSDTRRAQIQRYFDLATHRGGG